MLLKNSGQLPGGLSSASSHLPAINRKLQMGFRLYTMGFGALAFHFSA